MLKRRKNSPKLDKKYPLSGTNWSSTAEIHPLLVHIGHLYTDNKSCIPQIHPVMAIIYCYIILLITVLIPITISDMYPDIMGVVETLLIESSRCLLLLLVIFGQYANLWGNVFKIFGQDYY